jgi:hypothetical protein
LFFLCGINDGKERHFHLQLPENRVVKELIYKKPQHKEKKKKKKKKKRHLELAQRNSSTHPIHEQTDVLGCWHGRWLFVLDAISPLVLVPGTR